MEEQTLKIELNITLEFFNELLIQIGDCTTFYQEQLLNFMRIIALYGAEIADQNERNIFSEFFINSDLYMRIEQLMLHEIQKENQEGITIKKYSNSSIKLLQIYLFLNKNKDIGGYIREQYMEIFKSIFINLNNQLKEIQEDQNQIIKYSNKMFNNIEILMIEGVRMLKILDWLLEDWKNFSYFTKDVEIYNNIISLLHINCFNKQCLHRINFPQTDDCEEIMSFIFRVLGILSWKHSSLINILNDNHDIISHIEPIIISSASSNLLDELILSPLVISGALRLLQSILRIIHPPIQQKLITSNLGIFLNKLSRIGRKKLENQSSNKVFIEIRLCSIAGLNLIKNVDNEKLIMKLIFEWKLMQVLIEAVGCCGGTGEQCGKVTKDALHDIFNLFYPLQPDRNLFAGHSELVKQIYEDIEEQGGTEDCVSNLYHTWLNVNDNVMSNANLAMKTIFNVCRDRSNKDDE